MEQLDDTTDSARPALREWLATAIAGLGLVLVVSPIFFYWLIHGSSERYEWLINGPAPFDQFGSGPYQAFNLGLFPLLAGMALIAIGWRLRKGVGS